MRLSPSHQKVTAAMLINELSEKELLEIFWHYGEERNARPIVHAIVAARIKKPITTTAELAQIILSCSRHQNKHAIHPATRIFQALRIVVNKELENIKAFLSQAVPALNPQGRLVCISFHSLEDRLVKQFFREQEQLVHILTPKVVIAQPAETAVNPSARSARLRAAEKI
jgi:16S rRNA (cytosine1402-N4)-methyltransferase